ncbi:MAG: PQQ-binding-like beta-propeller repeat protein [Candidatus Thermoplasmatota archaeon]|nr:PQQ-binding-like beta-propeller repeat protein [Candidatus Thermoplasmatota archaeon]
MAGRILKTIFVLLLILPLIGSGSASDAGWIGFRGDLGNTGYDGSDLRDPGKENISLLWEFRSDSAISTSMISGGNWVLFGTENGTIYRLNSISGALEWKTGIGSTIRATPLYIDHLGDVIVCDSSGKVTALSIEDGIQLWRYDTGSEIVSSPNGEGLVHFGSYDSSFYTLHENGSLAWRYTGCEGWIHTTPAVNEGKVYFGSCDGFLRCLDAEDGAPLWNFSAAYIPSSPAVHDGNVYFGSYDSNLYCLDTENGELIWNTTLGGDVQSSPAVDTGPEGNRVVVGCNDGLLYCLDGSDGEIIWKLDLGPGPLETSPVISKDIVLATYSQGLVMVDLEDGGIFGSFEYGDSRDVSPSVQCGLVFFGDDDGYVRCLRQEDLQTIDDDTYEIGREKEFGRDLIILITGCATVLVIGILFFRRYRKMREES